jgi:hypothetical protein
VHVQTGQQQRHVCKQIIASVNQMIAKETARTVILSCLQLCDGEFNIIGIYDAVDIAETTIEFIFRSTNNQCKKT